MTPEQNAKLRELIHAAQTADHEWCEGPISKESSAMLEAAEQAVHDYVDEVIADRPAKFEVVYDPLNKRYDIAVLLPSGRQVRKPILNGCIEIRQQQTVLDVKRQSESVSQLKDLIAYYQGLLAYVESKTAVQP